MIERRDRKGSEAGWASNQETGSSGPAARVQFKPARRLAGANPVLSLMKAELPRAAKVAYYVEKFSRLRALLSGKSTSIGLRQKGA
jgi:hypothetical protein